jgi:hypothetical protein
MRTGYAKVIKAGDTVEVFRFEGVPHAVIEQSIGRKTVRRPKERIDLPFRRVANVAANKKKFRYVVRACMQLGRPHFLTFTVAKPTDKYDRKKHPWIEPVGNSGAYSVEYMYKLFRLAMMRMRYQFPDVVYVAVPEFQKNGRVHFHLLVWGLPADICLKERTTRCIARIWGHGYVDVVPTFGEPDRLTNYVGKYMRKGLRDERLRRVKAFTRSRNCPEYETIAGETVCGYLYLLLGEGYDMVYEQPFETKWLGQGLLEVYKLKNAYG